MFHLPQIAFSPALPMPKLILLIFVMLSDLVHGETNPSDVSALNVLYSSLNSPSQLTRWSSSSGDPCGNDWKGIKCSGSSVTEITLSGLKLNGTMGYLLSSLTSVTYFDLSKNNLNGDIPYQLPPNASHIDLAGNSLTGGIPYSISQMTDLKYLNLAKNKLSGQVNDMFGNLHRLSFLDISSNGFSGSLPQSLGSLSSLKTLNVENNQFTGWIPHKLKNVDNLKIDGNSWSARPAPPGMVRAADIEKSNKGANIVGRHSGLKIAIIIAIIILLLVLLLIILDLVKRRSSRSSHHVEEQFNQGRPMSPLVGNDAAGCKDSTSIDIKALETSSIDLKSSPVPIDTLKPSNDVDLAKKVDSTINPEPISLTTFSFLDLQTATGSFSSNRIIGQGNIGRVYMAKLDDGKVLAVKKLELLNLSRSSSYDFMDIISDISKLRHPNISELLGYCAESDYQLLVYELQGNGSLHGFLHLSDDYSKPLTWETRVRIALGTAHAIEYLHEVCSPSVIHKNVKSANILLDSELNPHLAECGLAIFFEDTSESLGQGYNAPECSKSGAYTIKSDVYSFGVIMLELLTGRMPFDSSKPTVEQSLVRWAAPQLHDIDTLARMVDPALRGLYPPKSLSRFADIIALCIQAEPEFRPAMSEIVQSLACCVESTGINMRMDEDRSYSRRSDDSDYGYY